ncbi:MAG: factor-independent urate hydroxylase [Kineosporiaceae bacterium]
MVRLGPNRYGKAEVRVVSVVRGAAPGGDLVRDRCVSTTLWGDFAATHLAGDNRHVVATDTQKNAVYAFTGRLGDVEPEVLALALARHFVDEHRSITRARVRVEEFGWTRIDEAPHAFIRTGECVRTTTAVVDEALGARVLAGVERLTALATTNSEFWGFPRDAYTTLAETKDRMLATEVTASWLHRPALYHLASDVDWAPSWTAAYRALLAAFSETYSYSLQQTLFAIGRRIVETVPEICEVRLTLPNRHHLLVDLSRFGQQNENEVYEVPDRPYGLIEGTVVADDVSEDALAWS